MTDTIFLDKFKLYSYHLPLNQALLVKNRKDMTRSGLIIEFYDQNGIIGPGEIAPLPGLHSETQEECISFLKEWSCQGFKSWQEKPYSLQEFSKLTSQIPYPSIQWGLNTAFLNLIANQKNCLAAEILSTSIPKQIELNALLGGSLESMLETATNKLKQGYTCFKLKVGQQKIQTDIQKVIELRALLGKNPQIRLDANRQWTFQEAIQFGEAIGPQNIEYIEEPTRNYQEFNRFFEQTGIQVALDESLIELKDKHLESLEYLLQSGISAFILKPALWGNLQEIIDLKKLNCRVVISSCFESGLGISNLAQIAAYISPSVPVGLDTYHWLAEDILMAPLTFHNAKLNLAQAWKCSQQLNSTQLQEIPLLI